MPIGASYGKGQGCRPHEQVVDDRWSDAAAADLRIEPDPDRLDGSESVDAFFTADAGDATGPTGSRDRIDPGDLHDRAH